ncbi:MAG: response regulator [Lachnospiraceae bacterium]|nr:response regulator [Lachnospiraceae bacterium]
MNKENLDIVDLSNREYYKFGYGMGQTGYQINEMYFSEHEKQMNWLVSRFLLYVFLIIPAMAAAHLAGLRLFSNMAFVGLMVIGTICRVTPTLLSRYVKNQMVVKYYTFLNGLVFVSYLVIAYRIGISIAFFLPAFASCLYFNPTFTVTMTTLSYICYLFSYYLRNVADTGSGFKGFWNVPNVWMAGIGFTVEFIISSILFYVLTIISRELFMKQKQMLGEIEKRNEKLRMAMGAATDILFEYNVEKDIYTSNRTVRGWSEKDIEIENFTEYVQAMAWETDEFITVFQKMIKLPEEKGNHFQEEICINFEENGVKYPAWANFEINIIRNEEGKPATILGRLHDITALKVEELKRKEEKHVDTLTGMYTYESFKRLVEEMSGSSDTTHQIMVLHIKNYQEIADCYGEVYRDFVILNTADYIKKKVEPWDILTCRLAADVFILYINDGDKSDGRLLRQELNQELRGLYIGEKEISALEYDFGYYSGKEKIDDLLQVAFQYIDEDTRALETEISAEQVEAVAEEERLYDIPQIKRADAVTKFCNNISSLILGAKDQQSTIQLILDRTGKFLGLDAVRIYEIPEQRNAVLPAYLWTKDDMIRRECALRTLSGEEQKVFVKNFGQNRIVDSSAEAFQDFFTEYSENPFFFEHYSTLICPLSGSELCQGILLFTIRKPMYQWSDEQKEHVIAVTKTIENYILVALNNDSIKQQRAFLTTMSRMLRMPMNSIFELTDIARQSVDNPTELIQYMDMIDVSSENMLHVVNNIIDLSKLNIESMTLNEGLFSLEDVLSGVEEKLLGAAREKHISLLIERRFGQNLLRGDSGHLEQVLLTLVRNAINYLEQGRMIHLRVSELSREDHTVDLSFEVEDNGKGLPKKALTHLFDHLSEGLTDRTEQELGTEIDLGVCYQLVRLMGSELQVESEVGKGTRFEFHLKFGQSSGEQMLGFLAQKKREELGKVELKEKEILIAEDDRINGEILKRLFEKNGARVDLAENGKRCLELFKKSREGEYAFILMDISMPVMNGHETTREIRKLKRTDAKKIPILALSANAFQEDVRMSMLSGMNAHLSKPIHMNQIMEELSKVQREGE